jgi:Lon protease-like protein
MAVLPMFPLGTVLFPGAALPLHVFEPRYRQLTADCLAGVPEFGVVLIERGNEVGGGDVRTDVGTVARIVATQPMPDGRTYLLTVGTRRIRVVEWLEDDPYPRADVEDWQDREEGGLDDAAAYTRLLAIARRALALAREVGEPAGDATTEFAGDPALGTFQIAALSSLGPIDRQRILATDSAEERCRLLEGMLQEEAELLGFRLQDDIDPGELAPGEPAPGDRDDGDPDDPVDPDDEHP